MTSKRELQAENEVLRAEVAQLRRDLAAHVCPVNVVPPGGMWQPYPIPGAAWQPAVINIPAAGALPLVFEHMNTAGCAPPPPLLVFNATVRC